MIEALQIKMKYLRNQGKGKSKLTSASSSGSEDPPLAKKRKFEAKQFPVLRLPPIHPVKIVLPISGTKSYSIWRIRK